MIQFDTEEKLLPSSKPRPELAPQVENESENKHVKHLLPRVCDVVTHNL